jgi:FtsP/CotA-like multicopper oxidase with cupredoxin domain
LFKPLNPPAIITHQGAVEDWTIENQAGENHEFHMHQIHFLVLEQNNQAPIALDQGQFLDMIQVPFWSGTGPFPSSRSVWTFAAWMSEILSTTVTFSDTRTMA